VKCKKRRREEQAIGAFVITMSVAMRSTSVRGVSRARVQCAARPGVVSQRRSARAMAAPQRQRGAASVAIRGSAGGAPAAVVNRTNVRGSDRKASVIVRAADNKFDADEVIGTLKEKVREQEERYAAKLRGCGW